MQDRLLGKPGQHTALLARVLGQNQSYSPALQRM